MWIEGGGRKLRVVSRDTPPSGAINHVCHAWSAEARSNRTFRFVHLEHTLHPTTHYTRD